MNSTTVTPAAGGSPSNGFSGWQSRSLHTITCPSGQRLRIRIPGIGTLLERGAVPDDLIELALLEVTNPTGAAGAVSDKVASAELSREERVARVLEFGRLQRLLVCEAVKQIEAHPDEWVDVTLDDATVAEMPEDDVFLVAEIVQRLRATDARGVRIGVEPLDRWHLFREEHGCAEGCEGCQKIIERFSTSDVGAV